MFLIKARDWIEPEALLMPITTIAFSIIRGSSSKSVIDFLNIFIGFCSFVSRLVSGITLIVKELAVARRKIISVANRVQRLLFLRNKIFVSVSKIKFFSTD